MNQTPRQVLPMYQDKHDLPKGKRLSALLITLCLLITFPTFATPKRHKKELAVPKDEKVVSATGRRKADEANLTKNKAQADGNEAGSANEIAIANKSCTEKYPLETFMQINSSYAPESSRFGGLYFLSDLRETPQLFYVETPRKWPQQITFFPDGVTYYKVSPDKEKILVATHVGGDEQYDIYLLNAKTRVITPLIVGRNKRVESVYWDPKSNWFAFTSTERNQKDMDLYRFDILTKKQTLLAELEGHHTVSDISPDGNLIALTRFRSITDSDLLTYDLRTKAIKKLFTATETRYLDNLKFTQDSSSILFLSDEQHGITQLFSAPLSNLGTKKLFTSTQWEVEQFILSDDRSLLLLSTNEEGYSRLSGYEISSNGKQKRELSVPKFQNSVIKQLAFSNAQGKGSFFFSETASNANLNIWLWHQGKKTRWTESTQAGINSNCFSTEELVHYESFDKKQIPAFIYLPKGVSLEVPHAIPFIVSVHGGPESQYRPTFSKLFQYFLQRGFGILAPNIRGSTGYGRDYTLSDNYKHRMDSIYDVIHGAQFLLKKNLTKPQGLAILGGSYGGFAVLRSIEVEPELFAAASESVGISNFVTFLENTKPYRRTLREIEYGPLSDKEFLKSISPMSYLEKIKTPLLIFHGANDPRVPLSESEQIVKALKDRDVPVELKVFPDEGHGNTKLKNILEQARLTAFFFEKYFKIEGNP